MAGQTYRTGASVYLMKVITGGTTGGTNGAANTAAAVFGGFATTQMVDTRVVNAPTKAVYREVIAGGGTTTVAVGRVRRPTQG